MDHLASNFSTMGSRLDRLLASTPPNHTETHVLYGHLSWWHVCIITIMVFDNDMHWQHVTYRDRAGQIVCRVDLLF